MFSSSVAINARSMVASPAVPVNVTIRLGSVHSISNEASASHAAVHSASAITFHSQPSQRGSVNSTLHSPLHEPMHIPITSARHDPEHDPVHSPEHDPVTVPMH